MSLSNYNNLECTKCHKDITKREDIIFGPVFIQDGDRSRQLSFSEYGRCSDCYVELNVKPSERD
jgi:hypothetical protein